MLSWNIYDAARFSDRELLAGNHAVAFEWVDEDTVYPVTALRRDRER